ncbi:MAG: PPC domain-containing DNA-binding protein [Gaiellaceae bacterium]
MNARSLNRSGVRSWVLVFDTGDEAMAELRRFARTESLSAAQFTGIGAFSRLVGGYFDWERKDYLRIPIDEQVEVLALTGDVALDGSEPAVHAHVVVGRRDGSTAGGHLLEGHVRPTLELVVTESPVELRKSYDPRSGLMLIDAAPEPAGEAALPRVPEESLAGRQARRVVEHEQVPRSSSEEGGGAR